MDAALEYLISHGKSGAFGRFAAGELLRRGDRVVIRGQRGLELGTVLCLASERQRRLLNHTPLGKVLRQAAQEDETQAREQQELARRLTEAARALVHAHAWPFEILDAEILLDQRQAIVQCLAGEQTDFALFLIPLESQFQLTLRVENLAMATSTPTETEETHDGCGKPNCGSSGGGCTDCSSGGCATGCGSSKIDLRDYFSHLRTKMEQNQRTPLL